MMNYIRVMIPWEQTHPYSRRYVAVALSFRLLPAQVRVPSFHIDAAPVHPTRRYCLNNAMSPTGPIKVRVGQEKIFTSKYLHFGRNLIMHQKKKRTLIYILDNK